jgi:hypothetical protein
MEGMERQNWDTHLKLAAWAHNSAVHSALKVSPYEMVIGMKPNPQRMWLPEQGEQISEDKIHEYFGIKKTRIEKIRSTAIAAIEKGQAGFLKTQEGRRKQRTFSVGQKVWVKNHTASKWAPKYFGPYLVHKVISESVLWLKDPNTGHLDTVHTDYIKPYFSAPETESTGQARPFPADPADTEKEVLRRKRNKRNDNVLLDISKERSPINQLPQQEDSNELFADEDEYERYTDGEYEYEDYENDDDYSNARSNDAHISLTPFGTESASSRATYSESNDDDNEDEYTNSSSVSTPAPYINEPTADEVSSRPQPGLLQRTTGIIRSFGDRFFGRTETPETEVMSDHEVDIVQSAPRNERFAIEYDFNSVEPDEIDTSQPSGYRESENLIQSDIVSDKKPKKRRNADQIIAEQTVDPDRPRLRRRSGRKNK